MDGYELLAYGKNKVDLKYGDEVIGYRILTTEDETRRKDFLFVCLGQHKEDYKITDYKDLTWILLHECADKSGGALYWQPDSEGEEGYTKPTQSNVYQRRGGATSQPSKRRAKKKFGKKSAKKRR